VGRREIADLVEKERSAMGLAPESLFVERAGECT